ncbi:MAG: hypothetical protein ABSH01_21395 [Terriglobia bacterium]|jgi:hypothetical protein
MIVALALREPAYSTEISAKLTAPSAEPGERPEGVIALNVALLRREAVDLGNRFRRFAKRCERSSIFAMKFKPVVLKGGL